MGRRRQRGHGIGSVISGAFKSLLPTITNLGKNLLGNVGKNLLNTGVNIVGDLMSGKPAIQSVRSQASATGKKILSSPLSLLKAQAAAASTAPPPPPKKKNKVKKQKKKGLKRKSQSSGVSSRAGSKKTRRVDIFD